MPGNRGLRTVRSIRPRGSFGSGWQGCQRPECPNEAPDGSFRLLPQDEPEVALTGNLDEVIDRVPASIRWNWQQLLRGLRPHADVLERVRLVGSSGANGSFGHLDLCRKMLRKYVPRARITPHPRKADFKDFNGLVRQLREIVVEEKKAGMTGEDIVIDITGGPKTASIAGSGITFTTEVTFQYVRTHPPFEVYAYDVVQQPPSVEPQTPAARIADRGRGCARRLPSAREAASEPTGAGAVTRRRGAERYTGGGRPAHRRRADARDAHRAARRRVETSRRHGRRAVPGPD